VVFDLDGILIDSERVWDRARREGVAEAGAERPPTHIGGEGRVLRSKRRPPPTGLCDQAGDGHHLDARCGVYSPVRPLPTSPGLQSYGLTNELPGRHRHMLWSISLGAPENVELGIVVESMYAGPDWRACIPCSKA
jgi:hypothetical protein